MTTIKTPIESLINSYKNVPIDVTDKPDINLIIQAIESYHNQFDCIDKQTAIDFCQSILKDYSTQEVTQETLNKFLNKE